MARFVDYEVRWLAADGEVEDVQHWDLLQDAVKDARRMLADGASAVVIEQARGWENATGWDIESRTVVQTLGDEATLGACGWVVGGVS